MNEFDRDEAIRLAFAAVLPPGEDIPNGLSDQELTTFENRTGIQLLNVFRDWLKTTNGPFIGPGGMVGIDTPRSIQNIEVTYERHPSWRANRWIPVANDGFGNFYVLLREDSGLEPVAFVDCNIDPDQISYVAASNLWTFLRFYFTKIAKDFDESEGFDESEDLDDFEELYESQWPFDKDEVMKVDPDILKSKLPFPW